MIIVVMTWIVKRFSGVFFTLRQDALFACVLCESPVKFQVMLCSREENEKSGVKGDIALRKPCLQGRRVGAGLINERREGESWGQGQSHKLPPPHLV